MKAIYIHYPTDPGKPLDIFVDCDAPEIKRDEWHEELELNAELDLERVHVRSVQTRTGFSQDHPTVSQEVADISGVVFVFFSNNRRRQYRAKYNRFTHVLKIKSV